MGWVSQASGDVHELELIGEQLLLAPRPATTHMVRVLSRVAQNQSGKVGALAGAPVSSLAQGLAVTRGAHALFTGWVVDYGVGVGCAAATTVALIESTGRSVTGVPVGLSPFAEHLPLAEFEAAVASALAQQRDPLLRVKEALDLTDIEVALLFAVSRQAVAQWWTHGVPAARMTAVADIVATVDLLARKLKPGRLPLVARQPAERLGGKTLLHALADDPASTRAVFEEAFDWSAAA
ncbi:MAG: hypothetical protein EBU85_04690 [Actinobacteria bacterium]|nr:hypothetical protein [Actinomycetota bacterium]